MCGMIGLRWELSQTERGPRALRKQYVVLNKRENLLVFGVNGILGSGNPEEASDGNER